MAITKRVAEKVTVESAVETAPVPSTMARVILVNKCSTYVTPEREVFYSKNSEGSTRVYEVPMADLGRLLSYRDDFGRRFFKQTEAEVTDERPDTTAKTTSPQRAAAPPAANNEDSDDEELDTGAMRLRDRDGNEVGVTV